MRLMTEEERKNIKERIEKKTLKFIGFISEEGIKLNKNKSYIYFIDKRSKESNEIDKVLFGSIRNVYVYKEEVKNGN
jgi:hypothetical protein